MYASAEKRVWTWRSPKNGIRSGSYRLHGSRVSVRGHGGSARAEGGARTTRASTSPRRDRVNTSNPSDTGRLAVKVRRGAGLASYIVRSDRTPGGRGQSLGCLAARLPGWRAAGDAPRPPPPLGGARNAGP